MMHMHIISCVKDSVHNNVTLLWVPKTLSIFVHTGNAEQSPPAIAVSSPQSDLTIPAVTTSTPGATSSAAHQQLTPTSTTCSTTQQQPVVHWSAVASSPTKEDLSFSDPKPISLSFPFESIREYQKELAGPGLNGKNYIICAPTGSGKTLVAAMIISEHLKRGQEIGEERKVLFMVKTQQLAHQQTDQLKKYLDGARIDKLIGDGEQEFVAPLTSILPSVDLVVCTAGKIFNELNFKRPRASISQFSLLVVDESHHTVGSDQYSEVLELYLMEKLQGSNKVPQVVSLTASPGAGKGQSPSLGKAVNHQLELCARLDAFSGIKMVTDNVDELLAHTNKPEHNFTELKTRSQAEPFIELLVSAMKKLEELIKGGPRYNKNTLQYKAWVKHEMEIAELKNSPDERDRISVLQYLSLYFQALTTYEDFTCHDAIETLEEIKQCPEEQATPMERILYADHKELLLKLSELHTVDNPLLEGVEKILLDHFTSKSDSKAIFFVREIRHTHYVHRWVEGRPSLRPLIHTALVTGNTRAGMTKEQQLEAIRGFKSGKYNLLVSTSVLEEGIDVAACNLVIRFQILTNEIAEVQAQGRARAHESKMYTIMASQSEKQCLQLINEEKQLLALKAPPLVTELCKTPKFSQKQKSILAEREMREKAAANRRQLWKPEDVEVVCKKCKVVACKGSDIYRLDEHHLVPNSKFRETKMIRQPHHNPNKHGSVHNTYKIYCRSCDFDWGVWTWWSTHLVEYPVLKCVSFNFRHSKTEQSVPDIRPGKQWSKVPFEIGPLPMDDFDTQ